METLILDGKALASKIEAELSPRVRIINEKRGKPACLATILVGNDPSSAVYVAMKGNACRRVGLDSRKVVLPEETTTEELLKVIGELNRDPDIAGILLQHPVPHQIDENECFNAISIDKDVDGVTALGFGKVALGQTAFKCATPGGIMKLIEHYQIETSGKHAVVVGRSPILGKPMAMMLLNANATVTVCHSKTRNLPDFIRSADIVVGAVGKPAFIQADWVKEGSVLIDAGYHPDKIGDIDPAAFRKASAYTPVPGGVGPMTIATLISQTVEAAEKALG